MKNLIVLFGGKSAEHDISLITANLALNALDEQKYNIFPIFIDKLNHWFWAKNFKNNITQNFDKVEVFLKFGEKSLFKKTLFGIKKIVDIDCALLCCHGLHGEDGTIQSVLELCNIPYSSSNPLSSGICMDKVVMKILLEKFEFNVVPYLYFYRQDFEQNKSEIFEKIEKKLDFPVIIKPANLGSSIGISVAKNRVELEKAVETALCFDNKILVEKALENFKEINCACLGHAKDVIISSLEEPISYKEFLTFDEKYLSSNKKSAKRIYPAKVSIDTKKEIQQSSAEIFDKFELSGVVRIDFMICDNIVYVNEINTIPGSVAYYLFEKENLSFSEVLDKMIDSATMKQAEKQNLTYAFKSEVLSQKPTKK
ncbi:MAG: D-alanine--D-alanine ligase family protein [Christensenellales bacterium]